MIMALLLLAVICIVVCVVKRNRGGKYAVHEQEERHGRPGETDEYGGFPEYQQPLDGGGQGGGGGQVKDPVMAAAARLPSIDPPAYDEDNDSMAEYADDVNPNGLNEDG